jgi:1-acyl-sn-glycerol-3-phosphate acyltransferase
MNWLQVPWRVLRVLARVCIGWCTITFEFPKLDEAARQARVQAWSRQMLGAMGIGFEVAGEPPRHGPLLLVANHISWLDILVLHAARHCRFVSKSEVRHWPVLGTLATGAGTLYIEREKRRDAMRVVHHMAESLRAGDIVGIFPEGTTTDGRALLPFHANLVQAAVSANAPVLPVALRYVDMATGADSMEPLYGDDETLVASVLRTIGGRPFKAYVRFGEPQHAEGRDRRTWAADLREAVQDLRGS